MENYGQREEKEAGQGKALALSRKSCVQNRAETDILSGFFCRFMCSASLGSPWLSTIFLGATLFTYFLRRHSEEPARGYLFPSARIVLSEVTDSSREGIIFRSLPAFTSAIRVAPVPHFYRLVLPVDFILTGRRSAMSLTE